MLLRCCTFAIPPRLRLLPTTPPLSLHSPSSIPRLSLNPPSRLFTTTPLLRFEDTGSRDAVPLPITAHGPPPKPPLPAPGELNELRRRQRERIAEATGTAATQQTTSPDSTASTPTPTASAAAGKSKSSLARKRFYKEANVKQLPEGTYHPHLDHRPLKTPQKNPLIVPEKKAHLAHLIAQEWNSLSTAQQATKSYLLPITHLTSRVIDLQSSPDETVRENEKRQIVETCMKYLYTDTLLTIAPPPNMFMISEHPGDEAASGDGEGAGKGTLRHEQIKVMRDTVGWLERNLFPGIVFHPLDTAKGFLATQPQEKETVGRVRSWIEGLDIWQLVGLERCVVSAKSTLIGVRLVAGWISSSPSTAQPSAGSPEKGVGEEENDWEIDPTTGLIPPSSNPNSFLHNHGTNTSLSHTSPAHSKPPVSTPFDSPHAKPGLDADPVYGGITSGDPQRNSGTNTSLAPSQSHSHAVEEQKTRRGKHGGVVGKGGEDWKDGMLGWGIEEAARAASLEVEWQTRQWGEVEDSHDVLKEDVRRGLGAGWCLVVEA